VRLIRLALATLTISLGIFCLFVGLIGMAEYVRCRGSLGGYEGSELTFFAWACNYDARIGLFALALAAVFGAFAYLLLRSRWRPGASVATRRSEEAAAS
jgi:hypothetical protein